MTERQRELVLALIEIFEFALRYLDHPEVKAIPFALSPSNTITNARQCIAELKKEMGIE